jgi:hypothetical protein
MKKIKQLTFVLFIFSALSFLYPVTQVFAQEGAHGHQSLQSDIESLKMRVEALESAVSAQQNNPMEPAPTQTEDMGRNGVTSLMVKALSNLAVAINRKVRSPTFLYAKMQACNIARGLRFFPPESIPNLIRNLKGNGEAGARCYCSHPQVKASFQMECQPFQR